MAGIFSVIFLLILININMNIYQYNPFIKDIFNKKNKKEYQIKNINQKKLDFKSNIPEYKINELINIWNNSYNYLYNKNIKNIKVLYNSFIKQKNINDKLLCSQIIICLLNFYLNKISNKNYLISFLLTYEPFDKKNYNYIISKNKKYNILIIKNRSFNKICKNKYNYNIFNEYIKNIYKNHIYNKKIITYYELTNFFYNNDSNYDIINQITYENNIIKYNNSLEREYIMRNIK